MPIYIIPTVLDKRRLRYYSLSQADNLTFPGRHVGPANESQPTAGRGGRRTQERTRTWNKLGSTSCRWRPI